MRIRTLIGLFLVQVPFVLLARLTPQNSSLMSEPIALVAQLATGLILVPTATRPGSPGWSSHGFDGQCP
jgi:hypothetical protein